MAIGAFAPLVFFVAILACVGVRLVLLWWRTRQLPEFCLGGGLLIVAASMPLFAIGRLPATAMELHGRICFSAGGFVVAAGISLMACFNYYVFRRGSAGARTLLFLISGTLFAAVAYMSFANLTGESVAAIKRTMRPGTLAVLSTIFCCFVWGGFESFRCWGRLKRQAAVGLGNPVVANRFWLWGVASATCAALLLALIAFVLTGMTIVREPVPLTVIAAAGTIMSASWYLTFFAPERYLRFVRERAG